MQVLVKIADALLYEAKPCGIQMGQSGADLWFSYFVMYFVTGKFWTLFSLLFGMGFAVMLMRAETAQRSFLAPYLRRIAALAVFGALHYIFLWSGDILFSYAVAATALLIVLFGKASYILAGSAAVVGASFIPGLDPIRIVGIFILVYGSYAWYLRCPERITVFKRDVPVLRIVIALMMMAGVAAIMVSVVVPDIPHEGRIALPIAGFFAFLCACLMAQQAARTRSENAMTAMRESGRTPSELLRWEFGSKYEDSAVRNKRGHGSAHAGQPARLPGLCQRHRTNAQQQFVFLPGQPAGAVRAHGPDQLPDPQPGVEHHLLRYG